MERIAIGRPKDTNAWIAQVWISWVIAVLCTSIGIFNLPVNAWQRAFLGMGMVYSIGSTFTLAKTIRDKSEAERLSSRVDEARIEKILTDVHPLK